jgi:hypothetical protein
MNKQIKAPKETKITVKIISVLMFLCGLIVLFWMEFSIVTIIISLLSIIASIGLWKIRKWGLFVSYLALSGVISVNTIVAIICIVHKEVPGIIADNYLAEVGVQFGPPLFVAIIILCCLWWNKKIFFIK